MKFNLLAASLERGGRTCVSSALVNDWMALSKAWCAPNWIAVIGAIELAFTCNTAQGLVLLVSEASRMQCHSGTMLLIGKGCFCPIEGNRISVV